ncbi:Apoptosis regulator bax [Plakobranchus ocellatus]|uniref:Apoptosis regulator bax n=1 Tax=Plakobranchus ocellatus TaxID=259542 RepID=A0AAV3ZDB7_9GAST|nr:Apoptosis regulator bax [Plakobranchus ocellatus]
MLEQDGIGNDAPAMELLQEMEAPRDLPPEHVIEIKRAIKTIIAAQDEDDKLRGLISQVPQDMNEEVTFNVAARLFDDGIFNWGRVVGLFYLAYKICKGVVNVVGLLRSLIDTIISFMRQRVMGWILQQGGWEGFRDFVRRTSIQKWFVFGSVAALAGGIVVYNFFLKK